jgi:RNA polymerase sigma-70 factor (ECF subfamily)
VTPSIRLVPRDPEATGARSSHELKRLVQEASAGDIRAFAGVVDAYYARCLRFATHMLGERADAEEAVQDTFVRLHRSFSRYRDDQPFEPWLFRILGNRCRTAGGRARRHAQLVQYGDVPDRAHGVAQDTALAWREEIAMALRALPLDQREAFLMRHVEALSYEDMVVATGVGLSALKMRVKRACDTLRVRLGEVNDV